MQKRVKKLLFLCLVFCLSNAGFSHNKDVSKNIQKPPAETKPRKKK